MIGPLITRGLGYAVAYLLTGGLFPAAQAIPHDVPGVFRATSAGMARILATAASGTPRLVIGMDTAQPRTFETCAGAPARVFGSASTSATPRILK
jgi:hypothetical protein